MIKNCWGNVFFLANKNSEYQVCPAKIRKTKNCKCKLLINEETEPAFKQYYKIDDIDTQKYNLLQNRKDCSKKHAKLEDERIANKEKRLKQRVSNKVFQKR